MKKAVIVNPYWDSFGGGERYTATFIKLLISLDWQVDIVWPKDISSQILSQFGIDISMAKYVDSSVYTSKYNLAFYVSDGSLPLSFAKKTIIHFQFPFKNIGGKKLLNRIKSKHYTFICNSDFTKTNIDKEFGINSHVIYPPVSTSLFLPLKKTSSIIYLGRFSQLTQKKNQHLLIEAFKIFLKKYPSWKLILAGGSGIGTENQYVQTLLEESKKLPIEIIQNPSLSRLQELYAHSSIFWSAAGFGVDENIHPHQVEHFGISLVEAMAAGCVPIVSNLGGHKEIVQDGQNGYLVENNEQLVRRTIELVQDKDNLKILSDAARARSKIFDEVEFNMRFASVL